MREEYQKSVILVSMILIFGTLYGSSFFDRGSARQNNYILFGILTAAVSIGYLQTKKLKEWKEDKNTDYLLVYWSYLTFTIFLFFYLMYIVVTRSELECMRLIKITMTRGMYHIYDKGGYAIHNIKNYNNLESVKKLKKIGRSKFTNLKGGSSLVSGNINNPNESVGGVDGVGVDVGSLTQKENVLNNITVTGAIGKIFNGYKKIWKKILFIKN
jgi:hypothetical protein